MSDAHRAGFKALVRAILNRHGLDHATNICRDAANFTDRYRAPPKKDAKRTPATAVDEVAERITAKFFNEEPSA